MNNPKAEHDDPSIAKENARIQREKQQRERQFTAWDSLTKTPAFDDYLALRGLDLRHIDAGLPHAPEAESAVLGAMLLSGRACRLARSQLRPPCFGREFNRLVFLSCAFVNKRARQGERIAVDLITVASQLRRDGHFERVGGASYLTALIDSCPSAVNVKAYIREILECSRLRHEMQMAELIRVVASSGAHPDHIANATRKTLDALDLRGYCDLKAIFEECK